MSTSPNRLSLLLPAYLNGTLSDGERRWVDEQLAASAAARAELDELRLIQGGLQAHWDSEPAPSPSARARVMAAIAAPAREPAKLGLGARIGSALNALFAPKWVPAAALALIVLQFGILISMSARLEGPGSIDTRGGENVTFPTRLKLVLQPDAKQSDVTALLKEMHAEVIGGPDTDGTYVLGLRTQDAARIQERLALARSRSDIVATIDLAQP